MAGKVVNSSFLLLSKFGASRQESTSKTATSHIRKPLYTSSEKPTAQSSTFHFARASQNKKSLPFSTTQNC